MQIFPSANNSLTLVQGKKAPETMNVGWPLDMATVIIFSCKASCGDEEWIEECALLQTESGESVFSV